MPKHTLTSSLQSGMRYSTRANLQASQEKKRKNAKDPAPLDVGFREINDGNRYAVNYFFAFWDSLLLFNFCVYANGWGTFLHPRVWYFFSFFPLTNWGGKGTKESHSLCLIYVCKPVCLNDDSGTFLDLFFVTNRRGKRTKGSISSAIPKAIGDIRVLESGWWRERHRA